MKIYLFRYSGLDESSIRNLKRKDALRMLADVKDFLLTGGDINTTNDDGTSLVSVVPLPLPFPSSSSPIPILSFFPPFPFPSIRNLTCKDALLMLVDVKDFLQMI